MKAFIRVIVVVAVVFIIIGFAIAVSVGVIKGPAFINEIEEGRYAQKEGQNTIEMNKADFDRIKIDIVNADVTFKEVEGDTATIVYDVFRGDRIDELKGADFGLDEENEVFNFFDISKWFRWEPRDVVISIPKDSVYALKINVVNGRISGENVKFEDVDIGTTNASIDISGIESDKDVKVINVNGSITIDNIKANELIKCTNVNGKIENEALTAATVELTNVNGKVTGEKLKADNITLRSTNGSLNASVYGKKDDYKIKSNFTNGSFRINGDKYDKNNTLNASKDKSVTLNATNGSGDLDFLDGSETSSKSASASVSEDDDDEDDD